MDAFRSQMTNDTTKQKFPSVPVSMYAIVTQPDQPALRCLIAERLFPKSAMVPESGMVPELVLTCSPDFTKNGVNDGPDNIHLTLRADGTYVNDGEKMAVWISKKGSNDAMINVCDCNVSDLPQHSDGDEEVTCNSSPNEKSDPGFILSKISDDDMNQLMQQQPSLSPADATGIYRLSTNEGNMCRLIDPDWYVTCVTTSNETANNSIGVYFKMVPS